MLLDMCLPRFDMYAGLKFMLGLKFTIPDVTSFLLDTNYSDFKKSIIFRSDKGKFIKVRGMKNLR